MRLVRARELVLTTDAPIIAICFDVGYSSVGTFTRRFTASVGVSPRRLRWFSRNSQPEMSGTHSAANRSLSGSRRADVLVHCCGLAEDAQLFVGAFPAPVPIGRPAACAMGTGNSTVVLRNVPPGRHYVLGAVRRTTIGSGAAGDVETFVGVAEPSPVHIEGRALQEVTLSLRPVEVTDPPVVSFLPLLLHESGALPVRGDIASKETPVAVARSERSAGESP
jgi:hypothetical protein